MLRRFYSAVPKQVYLQHEQDGISTILFNNGERKNAIGRVFLSQFAECLDTIRREPNIRILIIKSNVPRVFCAGADLKERLTMTAAEVDHFVHTLRATFTELSNLPIPTISCIDGVALGGGMEIALATDFRVAGEYADMGLPETKLAIIPGAGGTQRLPRIVGTTKAKELIFTGQILNSTDALKIGLVDYAVDGSAYPKALELSRKIIPQGPIALRMAKLAIDKGIELDINSGLALEQACYGNLIATKDRIEGLTAFKEKRKPIYKGE